MANQKAARRTSYIQTQILVWCGDEPLVVSYDGSTMWVPPINKIAEPGQGSPYRLPAATTKAGVPLPGTILISDIIAPTEDGGRKQVFSVADCCATLERDCPEFFRQGFNIVSDPDDVTLVQAEGRPLFEASLDARAQEVLDLELARRKRLEDTGRPVTKAPNEAEVLWAYRHKQGRATEKPALSTAEIFGAISGGFVAPPAPAQPTKQDTPHAATTQALVAEAEEAGVNLTKTDLMALLRGDEEMIVFLRQKIAAKKEAEAAKATPAP